MRGHTGLGDKVVVSVDEVGVEEEVCRRGYHEILALKSNARALGEHSKFKAARFRIELTRDVARGLTHYDFVL